MKNEWPMKTLDELAEVRRGKSRHRPRTADALYGGPHPFVQTKDIHASGFRILSHSQTYSDFGLAQSKKWKAGTLCITNAGENTGDCAILGFDACFPDSIIGVTPLEGESDVRFLKYSLDLLRPALRTVTKGATQDNLSVSKLLSFPFPAPSLPTQRRIAGILSGYDDLIENNLRRIRILEEMAQSLYREWFVHFRFPRDRAEGSAKAGGHESVPLVDSPLGPIPEGWSPVPLSEIVNVTHGYAFKGKDFSKEPTSKILTTPGNFRIGGGIKYDKLKYYSEEGPIKSGYVFEPMDLMLTMTDLSKTGDTLGYPAFVPNLKGLTFLLNQ